MKTLDKYYDELGMEANTVVEQPTSQPICIKSVLSKYPVPIFKPSRVQQLIDLRKFENPNLNRNQLNEGVVTDEILLPHYVFGKIIYYSWSLNSGKRKPVDNLRLFIEKEAEYVNSY